MRTEDLKGGSLDVLVIALCRDYARRVREIENAYVGRRTLAELRYLNIKVLWAASEVVGERYAEAFVREIGEGIGYAKSELMDHMSEVSYKRYKTLIKENIAKKLHLAE